jgi:hypothetical protein
VGVDEEVCLDLVKRVGLPVLDTVLDTVLDAGGRGGTGSPTLSNFATRSLKDDFRVLKLGVDFAAAAFPYCNGDRICDCPNCDFSRELNDPIVASAKGSLYRSLYR